MEVAEDFEQRSRDDSHRLCPPNGRGHYHGGQGRGRAVVTRTFANAPYTSGGGRGRGRGPMNLTPGYTANDRLKDRKKDACGFLRTSELVAPPAPKEVTGTGPRDENYNKYKIDRRQVNGPNGNPDPPVNAPNDGSRYKLDYRERKLSSNSSLSNAALSDPGAIDTVDGRCICLRPLGHIMCSFCGYLDEGRVMRPCDVHPMTRYLLDINTCPDCKSDCRRIYERPFAKGYTPKKKNIRIR